MNDPRMISELRTLEAWFARHPAPRLEAPVRQRLKVLVAAELAQQPADAPADTALPQDLRARLQAAVRVELRRRRSGRRLIRLSSWLSAAAVLVLAVTAWWWFHNGSRDVAFAEVPELGWTTNPELADIEMQIMDIEWQAEAREFVLFAADEGNRELKERIGSLVLPAYDHGGSEGDEPDGGVL